jgi:hypothetical protein
MANQPPPDPQRAEDVRLAVREYLYNRPSISQTAGIIHSRLAMDTDYTYHEVSAALSFLVSLGQVSSKVSGLGATISYQITAAGTLAKERGE